MRLLILMRERIACATPASGRAFELWYCHRALCVAGLAALACAALFLMLLVPCNVAYGFDIVKDAGTLLDSWAQAPMQVAYTFMTNELTGKQITQSFNELITGGAAGMIKTASEGAIQPVGRGIVAVCALVQMITISSRFDSNGVAVEVREVFFLMIYCVLFFYLIDNSYDLCQGTYDVMNAQLEKAAAAFQSAGIDIKEDEFLKSIAFASVNPLVVVLMSIVFLLAATLAGVVVWTVTTARYLQIYLFTLVAPIPLAFLAQDETKQWGVGFIRNYLALCLAGFFLVAIIALFPVLMYTTHYNFIAMLGCLALYIFALIKSGSWARDILGG